MKISIWVYILLFVVILGLLYFFGQRILKAEASLLIDELQGTVEVQRAGESAWQAATAGQELSAGDKIRTGADAEVDLRCGDLSHIRLDADTMLAVLSSEVDNMQRRFGTDTELLSGKIWVRMREKLERSLRFTIVTPLAEVTVRGTIFSVEMLADGSMRIETYEGNVGVKQGNFRSMIEDEQFAVYKVEPEKVDPQKMSAEQVQAWKEKSRVVGAFVSVLSPQDGAVVSSSIIEVSGYTDSGNVVEVNGIRANIGGDGKWTARTALKEGDNVLTIQAIDNEGRQRNISLNVTYK